MPHPTRAQPSLFDRPRPKVGRVETLSIDGWAPKPSGREAFEQFHAENPHIYRLFKKFTFDAINAGRERFSARTVLHRIRWYTQVETRAADGFKVNNNWSPFYARMFEAEYPHHVGFFEKRTAIADREETE